jgi:hypothetical protein
MGSSQSITVQSVDDLPDSLYKICLEKAKQSLNEQYGTTDASKLYFPDHSETTFYMDMSPIQYRIKAAKPTRFIADLEAYCKELIQKPYICIDRTVYLVQGPL